VNRSEKAILRGHKSTVRCVKVLSATRIISGSRYSTMRIWNIDTGECEAVLEGHTGTIRSLALSGDAVVSRGYDHDARVWSLERRECLHVLKGHEGNIYVVAFDGEKILTGGLDGGRV
jgi:F-box and WD-40 domain protein CDC4